ncbi:hypothetical protein LJC23_07030 [Desulfovibrio sp. OttesenSCG-928-I05]|nr:hypothetical protein [Desulfovibrio sp. OttesenSCG-928-I05]
MNTIMPQNELVRRAARWICEETAGGSTDAVPRALLDEAGMRFNLSPNDCRMLEELFSGRAGGNAPSPNRDAADTGNNDTSC